jgi:hypothetical protein
LRIVSQDGADSDDNGVHSATQFVGPLASRFACNPSGMTGSRGDFPVERHRPFSVNVGPTGSHEFQVRCVDSLGLRCHQSNIDIDAGFSESSSPIAGY